MTEQRRTLAKKILNHIHRGEITTNGEGKLPSERDMASFLGVTRPILRQAIAVLEAFGVLEIRDRQGIFMTNYEISEMVFPGDWPPSTMLEIFQVRMLLEPSAARMVAENRTPEALRTIKESVAQMAVIIDSERPDRENLLAKWNRILHARIIAAAKNQFLSRIYETISQAYESASTSIPFRREELPFDAIYDEHLRIVDAIERKDGDAAAALVLEHLQSSVQRAAHSLKNSGFGGETAIMENLFSSDSSKKP
jgi:GntR family transcriptional repressor for pyruvate dehydrogenase complex